MIETSDVPSRRHYDVVVAGARCAGAATAMLLARQGRSVLVVDPTRRGRDTLSTHALMRGAVLQLHRWGLLDAVRAAGTPAIRTTTFHYAGEAVAIPIQPEGGVDGLYAPRRTVLDPILSDAAVEAGAEVAWGGAVVDVLRDGSGRVRGVRVADAARRTLDVSADLVVGADGVRSRVARLVDARVERVAPHAAASVYGYWEGLELDGFHWHYDVGASVGAIPTNHGETCVFASLPPEALAVGGEGLQELFFSLVRTLAPRLAASMDGGRPSSRLRGFAGIPGFLRRSTGPGWALVGDAGYFRDPITAHGITDALRDAGILARAVDDDELDGYQSTRDDLVGELLDVTDRIAALDWSVEEVQALHLDLSRAMKREVAWMLERDLAAAAT